MQSGMNADGQLALERELRAALASGRIIPFYQPVVAFDASRITAFEVLARWKSDRLGWVAPDQFVPIVEKLGLISDLGDNLLQQACLDARQWPPHIMLALNISATQLSDPSLGTRILSILGTADFKPHRLELEITETALVERMEIAQKVIGQLRSAGVRIALDDFGTGYATLGQLLSFRFDRIKIDSRFVKKLHKDNNSLIIVRAILGLANELGLAVTAEGIENAEQLTTLKANGCREGQGYLFAGPVAAGDVPSVLMKVGGAPRPSTA
jgi:EAL domain-containing protein (putative c-di-GMP-specific phosphodiesterase class I)